MSLYYVITQLAEQNHNWHTKIGSHLISMQTLCILHVFYTLSMASRCGLWDTLRLLVWAGFIVARQQETHKERISKNQKARPDPFLAV